MLIWDTSAHPLSITTPEPQKQLPVQGQRIAPFEHGFGVVAQLTSLVGDLLNCHFSLFVGKRGDPKAKSFEACRFWKIRKTKCKQAFLPIPSKT